jgi:uncharacterized protein with PIN domain
MPRREIMRFVLDGMLGKLTRWLRMMGHDALYLNDTRDQDLATYAVKENRILLTSDVALYRLATARGADAYLVKGRTEAERLASLASRFKLDLSVDEAESRCPLCGSPLRIVSKEEVKERIPVATFNAFEEFWTCSNSECGKVYWQGSHWQNINAVFKKAREIQKRAEQTS